MLSMFCFFACLLCLFQKKDTRNTNKNSDTKFNFPDESLQGKLQYTMPITYQLDLLLTEEKLTGLIAINSDHGCGDHETLEFKTHQ